jgi:DNA repair exonuclease SbcCD ATPase subunit
MVNIILKEIRFTNFFQYGSNINSFEFRSGMTWINASNGVGKSTVIDAISMALFNKAYRDISLPDVVNSKNGEDAKIDLEFIRETSNGTVEEYLVSRTITVKGKSKVVIFRSSGDGEEPEEISKKAGVNQKYFEDEILGFNKTIFDNVICLDALSFNFLETKPADKRKLIESIISFDISKIKQRNAKEITQTKTSLEVSKTNSGIYQEKVTELEMLVTKLIDDQKRKLIELKDDKSSIELTIESLNKLSLVKDNEISEITVKGKSLSDELNKYSNVEAQLAELNSFSSVTTSIEMLNGNKDDIISDNEKIATELTSKESEISVLDNKIFECKNQLEKYNDYNPNIDAVKYQSDIDNSNTLMEQCIKKNESIELSCPTCNRDIDEAKIETIRETYRIEYKSHREVFINAEDKLQQIKDDVTIYARYQDLLTQLNTLNSEKRSIQSNISKGKVKLDEIDASIVTNTSKLDSIKSKYDITNIVTIIDDLNGELGKKRTLESDISKLREQLVQLNSDKTNEVTTPLSGKNSELVSIEKQISDIETNSSDDVIDSAKRQLDNAKKDYTKTSALITEHSDRLVVLGHIAELCSDDGVKKDTIRDFIPMLNYQIMKFLRLFSQPYTIEFTDTLEYKFISDMGSAKVYHGLSAGQKSRVNFSISIAFRAFVSQIADFDINVMFLDEFLDKSTDNEGLVTMAKILKGNADAFGSLCVMTHKGDDLVEEWDHIIQIENDGSYSSFIYD